MIFRLNEQIHFVSSTHIYLLDTFIHTICKLARTKFLFIFTIQQFPTDIANQQIRDECIDGFFFRVVLFANGPIILALFIEILVINGKKNSLYLCLAFVVNCIEWFDQHLAYRFVYEWWWRRVKTTTTHIYTIDICIQAVGILLMTGNVLLHTNDGFVMELSLCIMSRF